MKKGLLAVLAIVAVIALSVSAYAGRGMMGYGPGDGQCMRSMGGQGRGPGMMGSLTEDEIKKINDERNAFFKATEELRQDIYAKEMELNSEIAKKNIDTEKAVKLQKEISELESSFDQKRLEHMIRMKKLNPHMAKGFGMGMGMGGGCQGGPCGR
jgi:zinc resistance-associated protein